ncbi:TPA: hypothetical protein RJ933_002579 [Enterobacter hormaechei]|nr:hypothetical protein [Enterobacter hormaechei]
MSTTLNEWLQKTIAELEEERDATQGAVNEDAAMALAAMKLALASLEANGALANEGTITATQFKPVADLYEVTVPSGRSTTFTKDAAEASDCRVMGWSVQEYVKLERYQAAMLQGAEPVTTANKLPAIGWLRADYQDDNRGLRGNAPLFVLGKKDPSSVWGLDYIPLTAKSPVIPDGWVMVPIEPTYQMCEAMGLQWESPRFPDRYKAMLAAVKK